MRDIKYIVVHCSATPPSMDIGAYEIRKWHLDRGWLDIGYNACIKRDGTLEAGRDLDKDGDYLEEIGAHVKGHNKHSIGICMVGGVDENGKPQDNFTIHQYQTLAETLREWKKLFPDAIIQGHRDFKGVTKACPSFDVKSWWASVNNEETDKCQDTKHSLLRYLLRFLERLKALTLRSS